MHEKRWIVLEGSPDFVTDMLPEPDGRLRLRLCTSGNDHRGGHTRQQLNTFLLTAPAVAALVRWVREKETRMLTKQEAIHQAEEAIRRQCPDMDQCTLEDDDEALLEAIAEQLRGLQAQGWEVPHGQ